MRFVVILFLLVISWGSFSQTIPIEKDTNIVFIECEPKFPGGHTAMILFIQDNFDFTEIDSAKFDSGRVYITFYVEKDGSISEMDILNNKRESIKRVNTNPLSSMPNWTPACDLHGPIRDKVFIPINF